MTKYKITQINFDLDPGDDSIPQYIQDKVQLELNQEYINSEWIVEDEEDLVDEISNESGWCINSIDYEVIND